MWFPVDARPRVTRGRSVRAAAHDGGPAAAERGRAEVRAAISVRARATSVLTGIGAGIDDDCAIREAALRGSARRWLDEGAARITTPAFAAGLGAGIGSGIGSVVAGPTVTWTGGRERHRRRTTRNLPRLSVACANVHQAPAVRSTRQRFGNRRLSTTGSGVCGERASIPGLSIRPGFLCSACERQQENDDKQAHPPWRCKRDASLATKR